MPITGIFLLPPPPPSSPLASYLPALLSTLSKSYALTPTSNWTLTHRLFRSTNPSDARLMQILHLPHLSPETTVAITVPPQGQNGGVNGVAAGQEGKGTGGGETSMRLAPGAPTEDFLTLMGTKMGVLWGQRPGVGVMGGQTFLIGKEGAAGWRVSVGELKVLGSRGGEGDKERGRGTICEVELFEGERVGWRRGGKLFGAFGGIWVWRRRWAWGRRMERA